MLIDFFALLDAVFFATSVDGIHQDRAAWKPEWMLWSVRTHAAFLFFWRRSNNTRLMDASCWRRRGSRPFSITYPGRYRSWR